MNQETLEEAAEKLYPVEIGNESYNRGSDENKFAREAFIEGARWQAERMYSEEDMIAFMQFIVSQESLGNTSSVSITTAKYYLEQFKKK